MSSDHTNENHLPGTPDRYKPRRASSQPNEKAGQRGRTAGTGLRGAGSGKQDDYETGLPRVLLLASDLFSVHALRLRSRRAGFSFLFEHVATAAEFLERAKTLPDIAVCCMRGLRQLVAEQDGKQPTEILERLEEMGIAVLLVGGDSEPERAVLAEVRDVITGSLRRSQVEWLPVVLEQTLQNQLATQSIYEAEQEAESMAQILRDNQKLLAVGRLAGSIAHEINNPLEAVTNLLYLIGLDPQLSSPTRGYLETAQQELERVTVISKQTLNFYRETQAPQWVKLSDLLEEVLVLYSRKMDLKKMVVTRRYEGEESVLVFPGEIRQIFSNLVANAIDASPLDGRLSLRVHPGRRWSDAGVRGLRVIVADCGTGMSEETRRKVGKAFFTTKGQRGTGLGLWVSQAILKRYGGDLQLRSSTAPGRSGTTFAIFLPTNMRPRIVDSARLAGLEGISAKPGGRPRSGTAFAEGGTESTDDPRSRTLRFRR